MLKVICLCLQRVQYLSISEETSYQLLNNRPLNKQGQAMLDSYHFNLLEILQYYLKIFIALSKLKIWEEK